MGENLKIKFTLHQMIKNYCHLGHESKLLNPNNYNYLLGNYSGLSVIDINKSFMCLKSSFNIIKNIFLKNGFICFVLNNKNFPFHHKRLKTSNVSIVNDLKWRGGNLSNWKVFFGKKIWQIRIPSAVLINSRKESDFVGERVRHLPILVLFFIDTIHNVFKFDLPVFINNKSSLCVTYFYFIFYNYINKLYILKRIQFIEIVKKKVLNIFVKNMSKKNILWPE